MFKDPHSNNLNPIIKEFEFELEKQDLIENISEEFRKVRYIVAKGNNKTITKEMFKKAENDFSVIYSKELAKFQQSLTINKIINFKRFPRKLLEKNSIEDILRFYYDKDITMTFAEKVIDEIHNEWERKIDMEIDIKRGK